MKGTKEDDGDYQFILALEQQYRKLLNQENSKQMDACDRNNSQRPKVKLVTNS